MFLSPAGDIQPHRGLCLGGLATLPSVAAGIHLWLVTANTVNLNMFLARPPAFCENPLGHNRPRQMLRAFSFYNAPVQTLGSEILGTPSKQTKLGSGTLSGA